MPILYRWTTEAENAINFQEKTLRTKRLQNKITFKVKELRLIVLADFEGRWDSIWNS